MGLVFRHEGLLFSMNMATDDTDLHGLLKANDPSFDHE